MLLIVRTIARILNALFRFAPTRALVFIIVLVGGLAAVAVLIARSWRAPGDGFAVAFLAVFAVEVAGVIVLWLAANGASARSAKTLDGLLALSPSEFEIAVGRLLRQQGYRDVSVVGGSGDLAADILCRDRRGGIVAVQCKRKTPGQRVGSAEVQQFIGMISVHHGADAGIYVTTSSFTSPAVELASVHEITLVDGPMLAELVRGKRRLARPSSKRAA